jgi:AraC-like DNA-binding protein
VGAGGDEVQLSLYEVPEATEAVDLRAPQVVYYGMVEGRKEVRVSSEESHAESHILEAGASMVVPPLQTITVDFPVTSRYVVFEVDRDWVRTLFEQVAQQAPGTLTVSPWQAEEQTHVRLESQEGINRALDTMAYLFQEDPPNRDWLIDLSAEALLVHLLHTPSRSLLVGDFSRQTASGGLAAAVQYIQDHLDQHISIDELVEEAYMSKSSFYRHFGNEFDMSPLEYITRERVVRAREMLADADMTVTEVGHALGFSSTSYFIDLFKKHEGKTPKQYQLEEAE